MYKKDNYSKKVTTVKSIIRLVRELHNCVY